MIVDPRGHKAAFSSAVDGDMRGDQESRSGLSRRLEIDRDWATVKQVHGSRVVRAEGPGEQGEADAIWTEVPGLPLAVFTADCFGVVIGSPTSIGVAHAGWRGVAVGVVEELVVAMSTASAPPVWAAIGPGIGSCCFEVGDDVALHFADDQAVTSWEARSVDLAGRLRRQLSSMDVWAVAGCTRHEADWFSHREDGTKARMATLGWLR